MVEISVGCKIHVMEIICLIFRLKNESDLSLIQYYKFVLYFCIFIYLQGRPRINEIIMNPTPSLSQECYLMVLHLEQSVELVGIILCCTCHVCSACAESWTEQLLFFCTLRVYQYLCPFCLFSHLKMGMNFFNNTVWKIVRSTPTTNV